MTADETRSHELELWWSLSYASWLTLPRVLTQAMPVEWQDRLAALLHELNAEFPEGVIETRVLLTEGGRLVRMPEWLKNYRHPDVAAINRLRPHHRRPLGGSTSGRDGVL